MTPIGRRIVDSAVWTAAETWGRQAAMFAVFIVLARLLGAEAFGLAALAMVAPVILAVPVTHGIPDALIQRPDIDPLHFDSAFWLLAALGLALSATIWTSAGMIAAVFRQPLLADLIRWTSIIVAVQSLSAVPGAVLKRQLNFRLFALRTAIATGIAGAVGIVMAIADFGVWSLVVMQIVRAAIEAAVLLVCGEWRPRLRYSYSHCRELFRFAGPLIIQSLWTFVNDEIPKVVLGMFIGPIAVGIYAFARRPLELLTQGFLGPVIAVAMPAVSRVQDSPIKIDRFFDTSVRLAGFAGFPVFVGFAAIAPVAIPFVFGTQWTDAVISVQILMLLGLLRTVDSLCGLTILALGHSGLILKLNMTYTVLATILLLIAAQFSIEATMIALVASNTLLVPIFLHFARRLAQVDVVRPLRLFPSLAAVSVVMFVAVYAWQLYAPAALPEAAVIVCAVLFGAAIYGAGTLLFLRSEVALMRDVLLKLRS